MANIGKNIKKARMQKNMRQEDLASKLYVTRTTISNYETNRSNPDIETLQQIAEVLDTDVNALIYGEKKDKVNRRDVYVMLAILIISVILLVPVSYFITKHAKEYTAYYLQVPAMYWLWNIQGRGILKIVSIAVIIYLFLHTLQIRLPYPKVREIISCLLIAGYLAYMINTLVSFNDGTTKMFWGMMYLKSELYPTLFDGIFGILFGICSYQTLFFESANSQYDSMVRTFFKNHKRISASFVVLLFVSMLVINEVTKKEYVIYGTVAQNSTSFISLDVKLSEMDDESKEMISGDNTYGIDLNAVRNSDRLPGLFTEGMKVKIVIERKIFQLNGDSFYVYITG